MSQYQGEAVQRRLTQPSTLYRAGAASGLGLMTDPMYPFFALGNLQRPVYAMHKIRSDM